MKPESRVDDQVATCCNKKGGKEGKTVSVIRRDVIHKKIAYSFPVSCQKITRGRTQNKLIPPDPGIMG